MAKVLIFSDFHLHNWSYGASYDRGWNSRLLDQWHVADQIVKLADHHRVDYVVFCGDLFHTHGKVESGPLFVASDLFSRLVEGRRKVWALVGNHDLSRECTSIDWLSNLGVKVVRDVETFINDEVSFGFMAYASDRKTLGPRLSLLRSTPLNYWFLHQGVQGVEVGSDFVIPNEIFGISDLPYNTAYEVDFKGAFTGHYHNHRWVEDKLTVVGAPMEYNWGDAGTLKGCIILDTFTQMWEHFRLDAPRFVTLNGALRPTYKLSPESDTSGIQNCFVKVTEEVPPSMMEEIREKLFTSGARSVEFVVKQNPATIGMATNVFDMESLIERYTKVNNVDEIGVQIRDGVRDFSYAPTKSKS